MNLLPAEGLRTQGCVCHQQNTAKLMVCHFWDQLIKDTVTLFVVSVLVFSDPWLWEKLGEALMQVILW